MSKDMIPFPFKDGKFYWTVLKDHADSRMVSDGLFNHDGGMDYYVVESDAPNDGLATLYAYNSKVGCWPHTSVGPGDIQREEGAPWRRIFTIDHRRVDFEDIKRRLQDNHHRGHCLQERGENVDIIFVIIYNGPWDGATGKFK